MRKLKDSASSSVILGLLVPAVAGCGTAPSSPAAKGGPPSIESHAGHHGPQGHGGHAGGGHGGHEHGHQGPGHMHRFDDAERWSKVFDDPARDEWQKPERVVALLQIAPGMTAADLGAGTGYFTVHLARAVGPGGKVIAEDVEPSMVTWLGDRAKKEGLANIEPRLGAPDDPKLAPQSVDRILVVDTWHHVADAPAFARRLAAALKRGGSVHVVDFTLEAPYGPPKAMRLPAEAIAKDLRAAGLDTVVVGDAGLPHQYVVRGSAR